MVPSSKQLREELRQACRTIAAGMPRDIPPTKDELEAICRGILQEAEQPEGFLGWIMVVLSSEFWSDAIKTIPPHRRLFLLPHCLKHAEGCPADYDEFGLACKTCGACSIADFRSIAEEMGYKVLVAEGSPIVLKIIVSGHVDAIVGVACLNVLEKAIDKILLAGIPCMAVPLLSSDCRNTSVDEDWVEQMVRVPFEDKPTETRSYLHLMRAANQLFEPDNLNHLVPRVRGEATDSDAVQKDAGDVNPIATTEAIAHEFLGAGGKHSRPFITMAVYDAISNAGATLADGEAVVAGFDDYIKRTAMAIETFHKASLVHDDIQDNDAFRYGQETMHRQHGVSTAINVGDYLIGLGYRLVSRDRHEMGAETAADILDYMADAHLRLSEGQGAELIWRDASDKQLKPIDALKVYALKTAPAFESAFYCGLRLAGPCDDYVEPLKQFCRNLGVAFQILNDLKDWESDDDNKRTTGSDLLGGRPTLLWALALEGLKPELREELINLADQTDMPVRKRLLRARQLYLEAGVFETAHRLIDKHQQRAEQVADGIEPDELRRLMYYLVDTVLDRVVDVKPTIQFTDLSFSEIVPIVSPETGH
ncbi:MAG: polyprenyl synthetase family protein [Planctomycetota bacterium]|nr:polyprenyl synthetase family protein [Planctomycetota bacterium]